MTTTIPGFSAPVAGSEAPLEMLAACHGRIEAHCATLQRLLPHLLARGVDEEARAAAISLKGYFDSTAIDHHADEEDDLFPALIEPMAGSDAICLRAMIDGLTADHRALEACWRKLRASLERIAAGECVPLPANDVEALASDYQRHSAREENELLPMAARLLSDEDLARIGRAMRERRAIDNA
jgi:hemerythrin-like domain-containing protein